MNRQRHFPKAIAMTAFLGAIALGSQASAAVYTLTFERLGDPSIEVATLTFEDIGTDEVLFTLSHNEDSYGFITDLWMNLDPFISLSQYDQSPAIKFDGDIQVEEDGFFRSGYDFDLRQEFETTNHSGGIARLSPGDSVSFVLSGAGLDAGDFMAMANTMFGTESDVLAMIRIQGGYRMGGRTNGGNGGFLAAAVVPEPATLGVLSLGLIPLLRRRSNKR